MKLSKSICTVALVILGLSSAAHADVVTDQSRISTFAPSNAGLTYVQSR